VWRAGRYVASFRLDRPDNRNHALRANRALLEWITDQGLVADNNEVPDGDHFGCRYEAYLTDPRHQPRKTLWDVELAIRLQDVRP
jgi:hypothetical protein